MKKYINSVIRLLSIVLILSLFFSTTIQSSAASGASKDPKATINGFFTAAKQCNPDEMKKYKDSNARFAFFKTETTVGKRLQKLVRRIHSDTGFKWKILKVYTKGNTGYANVRVTYYDAYGHYFNGFIKLLKWAISNPFTFSKMDSNKAVSTTIDYIYNDYKKSYFDDNKQDLEQFTVKIPLKKIKGKWYIDKISRQLNYAVNCRITKAMQDIHF